MPTSKIQSLAPFFKNHKKMRVIITKSLYPKITILME